jgi:hypothetical protein
MQLGRWEAGAFSFVAMKKPTLLEGFKALRHRALFGHLVSGGLPSLVEVPEHKAGRVQPKWARRLRQEKRVARRNERRQGKESLEYTTFE